MLTPTPLSVNRLGDLQQVIAVADGCLNLFCRQVLEGVLASEMPGYGLSERTFTLQSRIAMILLFAPPYQKAYVSLRVILVGVQELCGARHVSATDAF